MLEIGSFRSRDCAGITRRAFLKVGATLPFVAATPLAGLAAQSSRADAKAKSVMLIWLGGGPSHLDLFDSKPKATAQYRGPFGAIKTRTPGLLVTELLPKLAQRSNLYSVIRTNINHQGGHRPAGSIAMTECLAATRRGALLCELRLNEELERPMNSILRYSGSAMLIVSCASLLAGGRVSADEPRRLTTDGQLKFSPVFVAGGKEIAYCVHDRPKRVSILRLNVQTGKATQMYPDGAGHRFDPAFSPDERFHAFARSGGPRQLSLVIVNSKTKKQAFFHPPGALRSTVRTPRFTRDGKRIVFTLNAPGGQQIASVNLQGKDLKKLTQSAGINGWPDISPDGKKIAFSSSRDGTLDIYVMDADGDNVTRLTTGRARNIRPAWSPDGKRIAFTSARDGNYEIYVMNADGKALKRLTRHEERDDYPVWHPDGKRLLWIAERKGRFDLYLMPVR